MAFVVGIMQIGDFQSGRHGGWLYMASGQVTGKLFISLRGLVGERIGLHPLMVIFALLAFGQLFGFVGVLLALPSQCRAVGGGPSPAQPIPAQQSVQGLSGLHVCIASTGLRILQYALCRVFMRQLTARTELEYIVFLPGTVCCGFKRHGAVAICGNLWQRQNYFRKRRLILWGDTGCWQNTFAASRAHGPATSAICRLVGWMLRWRVHPGAAPEFDARLACHRAGRCGPF
jgi:hypothetical protein